MTDLGFIAIIDWSCGRDVYLNPSMCLVVPALNKLKSQLVDKAVDGRILLAHFVEGLCW